MIADLGAHLRACRKGAHLSLAKLANRVGVSFGYLASVERNESAPDVALLWLLAHELGLGAGEFLAMCSWLDQGGGEIRLNLRLLKPDNRGRVIITLAHGLEE
jgi:transcriptional regulator with XRE-family HTH domain